MDADEKALKGSSLLHPYANIKGAGFLTAPASL